MINMDKVKLATVVDGEPKAPCSFRESANLFPGLLHLTFNTYLLILSVKQGGIKYDFFSLWYDSTWD